MILRRQISRASGGRHPPLPFGRDGDRGWSDLPHVDPREEIARAGRLLLLGNALLLRCRTGSWCWHAGRWSAHIGDRSAEIPGKRRPQLGNGFRQTRIVAWQIGEAIRGHPVAHVVELGNCGLMLRTECQEQSAANAKRNDCAKAKEDLAGEPRHWRSAGPQAHFLRRPIPVRWLWWSGHGVVGHDCGLPSVRTMRTFC